MFLFNNTNNKKNLFVSDINQYNSNNFCYLFDNNYNNLIIENNYKINFKSFYINDSFEELRYNYFLNKCYYKNNNINKNNENIFDYEINEDEKIYLEFLEFKKFKKIYLKYKNRIKINDLDNNNLKPKKELLKLNNNLCKNKISKQKINLTKILQNQNKEDNETIIELEIKIRYENYDTEEEFYILFDQNLKKNIFSSDLKKNSLENLNYFNNNNTKLYINDKETPFNYKFIFNKIGIYKIKIISNAKLLSLS